VIELRPRGQSRRGVNHARRLQYRRLSRAGRLALTSTAAAVLGLIVWTTGAALPGIVLLAVAVIVGLRARHWLSLAGRSAVGSTSISTYTTRWSTSRTGAA
jgi:hypothetical protein